jgi:DNA-binding PucR family transcriptional regulator
MILQGYMQQADPEAIAMQFYSPIYLLQNKYDSIPEREEEAISFLEKHITQFKKNYGKG